MPVRFDKFYRVFAAELKLGAVKRLEAGEALAAVVRPPGRTRRGLALIERPRSPHRRARWPDRHPARAGPFSEFRRPPRNRGR